MITDLNRLKKTYAFYKTTPRYTSPSESESGDVDLRIIWNEKPLGVMDGINKTFVLDYIPEPSTGLMLFLNGVLQHQGADKDFTLVDDTIVFNSFIELNSDDDITATYPLSGSLAGFKSSGLFGSNQNNDFYLRNNPSTLHNDIGFGTIQSKESSLQNCAILNSNTIIANVGPFIVPTTKDYFVSMNTEILATSIPGKCYFSLRAVNVSNGSFTQHISSNKFLQHVVAADEILHYQTNYVIRLASDVQYTFQLIASIDIQDSFIANDSLKMNLIVMG